MLEVRPIDLRRAEGVSSSRRGRELAGLLALAGWALFVLGVVLFAVMR